ncbi:MAG: tRNA pseudouridine(38-40) synthase TruA, partial [Rickettsiales bacterium]|nr:tRNA pseudouridine(38-40) synthase TruA [Rickettsiales bacterium]
HLENALASFTQQRIETFVAGRTDAGVHARGQVVHCDLADTPDPFTVMQALNFYLREETICIVDTAQVEDSFNARTSATRREYLYHIINRRAPLALERDRAWHVIEPLDIEAMRAGAALLLGTHDFTSYRAAECQAKSPIRTLDRIDIAQENDRIYLHFAARSFLHHMVRNIVGTLRLVGGGKWQPKQVQEALEAHDRTAAGPTAAAHGLTLMHVSY